MKFRACWRALRTAGGKQLWIKSFRKMVKRKSQKRRISLSVLMKEILRPYWVENAMHDQ